MAERRMFSSTVICSDRFIQMPHPVQSLYFHLCMLADDDGLVDRVQMTLRQLGLRPRHLQQLAEEGYVVMFDSGVLGIPHWRVHNQIRKDRYRESIYTEERQQLQQQNLSGTGRGPVANMTTKEQPSGCIGKERKEKERIDKDRTDKTREEKERIEKERIDKDRKNLPQPERAGATGDQSVSRSSEVNSFDLISQGLALYQKHCPSLSPCAELDENTGQALEKLFRQKDINYLQQLFQKAEQTPFLRGEGERGWVAELPWLLAHHQRVMAGAYDPKYRKEPMPTGGHRLGQAELEAIQKALAE